MPGFASITVAAIASSLLYSILTLRPSAFGLQQDFFPAPPTFSRREVSDDPIHSNITKTACEGQSPPVWPNSLIIVQRRIPDSSSKVGPARTVTYYDYTLGGNLIQITPERTDSDVDTRTDSEDVLWDLELNTGHSFYFRPSTQTCQSVDFPVGILRPDWLKYATPLGPSTSWDGSGRTVCGWTKADFIDYYVDPTTGIPDSWYFHTMKATFQVLEYHENPTIDSTLFIPPDYCTNQ